MEENHLELGVWQNSTPLIRGLENVIKDSKTTVYPNPEEWHAEAVTYAESLESNDITEASVQLLSGIPYEEIIEATHHARSDEDMLFRVRMGRKLLLVARDTIILSTKPMATIDYEILRAACYSLGQFADAKGKDTALELNVASTLHALQANESQAFEHAHSNEAMQTKIKVMLHSPELLHTPDEALKPDAYHKWRRDFRRIANTFALSVSESEDKSLLHFAAQGLVLNATYGTVNDAIDKVLQK